MGRCGIRPAGHSAALVSSGLRPPPLPRSAEHPTDLIGIGGACPRLGMLALRGTSVFEPLEPVTLPAKLTADQMRRGVARLERLIGEIEAFDATGLSKRWSPEQKALEATIEGTLVSVFGHDTVEYRRYSRATSLDHGGISIGRGPYDNSSEARRYVAEGQAEAVHILKSAIKWLHDEIGDAVESISERSTRSNVGQSQKIFVVHGHDDGARQTVARFIERIGFEAVILSEQANQGRTIIEKIEAHGDVSCAVVLLTPDDIGG